MKNQKELDNYEEETKMIQEDRKRALHDGFDLRLDQQSNENSNPLKRKRDENTDQRGNLDDRLILDERLKEIIDGRKSPSYTMIPFKGHKMRHEPNTHGFYNKYIQV